MQESCGASRKIEELSFCQNRGKLRKKEETFKKSRGIFGTQNSPFGKWNRYILKRKKQSANVVENFSFLARKLQKKTLEFALQKNHLSKKETLFKKCIWVP